MTETRKLIQFLSPWQGRFGVKRYRLHADGTLETSKSIKCAKLIRKAVQDVDGIVLQPVWPGRNALCLIADGETAFLKPIHGGRIDPDLPGLSINDPSFSVSARERLIYRSFTFQTDTARLTYRDMSGRLVGPQRIATELFPENDFSPFARLINILSDAPKRAKLLSDFEKRRFKYSRWLDRVSTGGKPQGTLHTA